MFFTKINEKRFTNNFLKYLTTQIIIDGIEIFVQRATSMKIQARTWCNYQHHKNLYALVGISPNGNLTFVSSLWTLDKKVSGLLEKLEPGNTDMADRGLKVADILACGMPPNIPPFKGGKDQLCPKETNEMARKIAM